MADTIFSDGQAAALAAAIGGGFSLIAWSVRSGFMRYEEAFKSMVSTFKAMADEHRGTKETLVKLEAVVDEGRNDIELIRELAERHLEHGGSRRSKQIRAQRPPNERG